MPTSQTLSKSQVDNAGDRLRKWLTASEFELGVPVADFAVLDQWRTIHGPPMQGTNMFLRSALKTLGMRGWQVKQRHKRQPQILNKLARQSIRLSQIEDIAGCRLILPRLDDVRKVQEYVRHCRSKTQLVNTDDYVATPRRGGYRAVHLHTVRDGMKVEIQLRSERQHQWAERVEEWDEVFATDLKHERGPEPLFEYLRLFAEYLAYHDRGERVPSDLVEKLRVASRQIATVLGGAR